MLEKMIVLITMYSLMLASDIPRIKQLQKREKLGYGAVMLLVVYFSVDYMTRIDLPSLHRIAVHLLEGPAELIVNYLKAGIS
ncbi:hypothetical protein KP806_23715 [Paenibacillus sp. N4]|uniref:hypothetical protein n=1 Tax=Paenibacillus vietnamensis TaxID=2590547 RepID=UPI001CD096CB|nr:hypothetical protein [Paenibacillus vietnamensis]MCA0758071.1 hypothetical protein [Paenibacillus vietnamensis]